ncbi:MAG: hypothetical protein M1327_03635 [Candidatus Thermoplasmatota archaeon]|nr:hypothetical protein [Candidatus Thermoplasmatota archaeon]
MQAGKRTFILFLLTEAVVYLLFYSFLGFMLHPNLSATLYYLYLLIVPLLLIITIGSDHALVKNALRNIESKDWTVFVTALFIWGYIFAFNKFSPFDMFYGIAIIDEINFRFLVFNMLSRYIRREYAVVIQAVLFMLLYMNYIIFEPGGYPGLYAPLYVVDMFSMGILYGVLAYLRGSIYLDLIIHLSLFDMVYFSPPIPGWIPYVMLPT